MRGTGGGHCTRCVGLAIARVGLPAGVRRGCVAESTTTPCTGWVGERAGAENVGPANGPEVNPRGQGPRGYGSAARRVPAFEGRVAGGVTPLK